MVLIEYNKAFDMVDYYSKTKTILIDGPRLRKRLGNEDRKLDNKNKIFKLQKRCARIILGAQGRHGTVDLFNILGWLSVNIKSASKDA